VRHRGDVANSGAFRTSRRAQARPVRPRDERLRRLVEADVAVRARPRICRSMPPARSIALVAQALARGIARRAIEKWIRRGAGSRRSNKCLCMNAR
jgi:hypothetical protein